MSDDVAPLPITAQDHLRFLDDLAAARRARKRGPGGGRDFDDSHLAAVAAEWARGLMQRQAAYDLDLHHAYRPEVVAEVAVHVVGEADWEWVAKWCGGTLRSVEDHSGEWSTYIDIPDVGTAWEGSWITLDHDGVFRVRTEVRGPERA